MKQKHSRQYYIDYIDFLERKTYDAESSLNDLSGKYNVGKMYFYLVLISFFLAILALITT